MTPILFIDIETTPGPNKPKPEEIKAPGNMTKPETIKAYQEANVETEYQKQALDSMKGQICCVGTIKAYQEAFGIQGEETRVIHEGTEEATMLALWSFIKEVRGQYQEPLHFVGWNILTFDIPWLWRKAIKYDLRYLRDSIPKGNLHQITDLMKLWAADFKDYCSLASVASFLGIPHEGGNGSEIYELWLKDDCNAIDCHCRRDIETCMKIYKRIMAG